jgi:hypothetical protein
MIRVALSVVALLILCLACNRTHSQLRGSFAQSQDGKTYLAVVDDKGGHCGSIKVDGKVWSYSIGQAGRIELKCFHRTQWCSLQVRLLGSVAMMSEIAMFRQ